MWGLKDAWTVFEEKAAAWSTLRWRMRNVSHDVLHVSQSLFVCLLVHLHQSLQPHLSVEPVKARARTLVL